MLIRLLPPNVAVFIDTWDGAYIASQQRPRETSGRLIILPPDPDTWVNCACCDGWFKNYWLPRCRKCGEDCCHPCLGSQGICIFCVVADLDPDVEFFYINNENYNDNNADSRDAAHRVAPMQSVDITPAAPTPPPPRPHYHDTTFSHGVLGFEGDGPSIGVSSTCDGMQADYDGDSANSGSTWGDLSNEAQKFKDLAADMQVDSDGDFAHEFLVEDRRTGLLVRRPPPTEFILCGDFEAAWFDDSEGGASGPPRRVTLAEWGNRWEIANQSPRADAQSASQSPSSVPTLQLTPGRRRQATSFFSTRERRSPLPMPGRRLPRTRSPSCVSDDNDASESLPAGLSEAPTDEVGELREKLRKEKDDLVKLRSVAAAAALEAKDREDELDALRRVHAGKNAVKKEHRAGEVVMMSWTSELQATRDLRP